jgi:asparagine synthase (glutamine-hydrolysing)
MCGLAGFVNLDGAPADAAIVAAMMRTIRHRGPDDSGQIALSLRGGVIANDATADAAIGCQRLKILDLSDRGHQPMANESGTIVIALNGEIYNAFDFRPELEHAGYRFRSRTDTEVVLYLYERYGLDGTLDRLNGMFAFVIADLRSRQIHLARDQFGIKPLYWTQAGSTVMFASEAKAFLAHPAFTAAIDEDHVDEHLAFRYVAGEASLLKNVRQLRPGHRLTIAPDGLATARYWSIPDGDREISLTRDQAVDRLDELMRRSVASQMIGDVRVGCQLSGGVDSSLVTAFAASASGGIDAFSVVFEDPKFSEEPWIVEAAAVAGAGSHRLTLSEGSFIGPLEQAAWHMDQPISHPNALALWQISRHARDRVTVLLSGEGADEVFAGYTRYAERSHAPEAFIETTQFQPASKLAKLRPASNLGPALARRAAIFNEGRGDHLANCLQYDMQTYLVDLLARQDRMAMAHGVENRVPFLDRRVVEFARTLPIEHLASAIPSGGAVMRSTKIVLKELARRTFGEQFAYRPKGAFNLPLSQYFRGARFIELMEDQLLPGMRRRGLVSEPAVRELWKRSLSAPALTEPFWIPVALELWAQQFVDRRGYVSA